MLNVTLTGAQMESTNELAGLTGAQRQNDITRSGGHSWKSQRTYSELKMADWLLDPPRNLACMLLKRNTAKQVNHPLRCSKGCSIVFDKK